MKKTIALALSLVLFLCATASMAETAEKTDLGTLKVGEAFVIRSKLPENYTFELLSSSELNMVGTLYAGEDRPVIFISIAYSEEYADVERFNDLDEATVQEIKNSFLDMDSVQFEDLETAHGTRLLKVIQADKSFVDIYTIYKGYELEFVLASEGETADADIQMLVDFISDMEFVAVE